MAEHRMWRCYRKKEEALKGLVIQSHNGLATFQLREAAYSEEIVQCCTDTAISKTRWWKKNVGKIMFAGASV